MRLSFAVRAHPARSALAEELAARLRCEIVYDRHSDHTETGKRALEAYDPDAEYHVVVEDDALLCRGFEAQVSRAADHARGHPLSLYLGYPRPHRRYIEPALRQARIDGCSYLAMRGPFWGVGLALPTVDMPALLSVYDGATGDYEYRIAEYYAQRGTDCWYTLPSLVEHRQGPSLLRSPDDRRAYWFELLPEVRWGGVRRVRELRTRTRV